MDDRHPLLAGILVMVGIILLPTLLWAGGDAGGGHSLIAGIAISILAATILAFIANALQQPLLLAYIAAGVIIGPQIGFGLVASEEDIQVIAEIGLIILLFMIGLEIDIKKLKESGKSLILSGTLQFVLCMAMGLGFFFLLGYSVGDGTYDALYLAMCCAISSTTIVVKLLYSKFELDTLAGRLTLGILIFQDLWAIIILGVQPNLAQPDVVQILWSFAKCGLLVIVSLLMSEYLLPRLFKAVAKLPEVILVASLGWCFLVAGMANGLGLSMEMGALIAGVAISTFPYNLDVVAKIVSIRDFFITLFFVALGMEIPNPLENVGILAIAGAAAVFLIASRFLSIYPLLYVLKNGHRVSLLTAINLSQISEFALVIASIGFAAGHIGRDILSIIIFIFVMTSISSTYMVQYSHAMQKFLSRILQTIGFKDVSTISQEVESERTRDIALIGFFRIASSLIREIQDREAQHATSTPSMKNGLMVIDFNPEVHAKLHARDIKAIYGDVSHMDTLHHAGIHEAKIAVSTIPDSVLVGTDNLKIIKQLQVLCPHAKIIGTAESPDHALKMYAGGADYVLVPHLLAAQHLLPILELFQNGDEDEIVRLKQAHIETLQYREEIV
jgi:Kef-type K+ transport system membrane component KefB